MSEIENVQDQQVEAPNELDVVKMELAEARRAIEALSAKKDELLKETKIAKDEKRRQAEIAEQVRQEKLLEAQKNGEFEKLWAQEKEEKQKLEKALAQDRQDRRNEKIELSAIKIATDLAKGDPNKAELLSSFVAKTIGNIADEYGRVDDAALADIKKQFETDKRYSPLVVGSQSAGGSAPGNPRGAQNTEKVITRQAFDSLRPEQRMEHIKKGGKIID